MGEVYRAHNARLDREVAIKVDDKLSTCEEAYRVNPLSTPRITRNAFLRRDF